MEKYKTLLRHGPVSEYHSTQDHSKLVCPLDEFGRRIKEEAQRRGLVLYWGEYAFSYRAVVIDPTPREYKDKDYSKIDGFFDWCHDNRLLWAEETSDFDRKHFGHKYRQSSSSKGDYLVDRDWRGKETVWKAPDKDKWYLNAHCWTYYTRDPRAALTAESATRLLQEYYDNARDYYRGQGYGDRQRTVRLCSGRYGWESSDTCVERIAVYDGDGSRGSFDYLESYDYAEIFLEQNCVMFWNVNGFNKEIEGIFDAVPEKAADIA